MQSEAVGKEFETIGRPFVMQPVQIGYLVTIDKAGFITGSGIFRPERWYLQVEDRNARCGPKCFALLTIVTRSGTLIPRRARWVILLLSYIGEGNMWSGSLDIPSL
jgi:hypothetical protein